MHFNTQAMPAEERMSRAATLENQILSFFGITNPRVCAGSNWVAGTDVSNWDPNTRWTTVQKGGLGFAFIKATEGVTVTNRLFTTDWAGSRKVGILRGAYHFFHPAQDPLKQAQHFLGVMGPLQANDLPPVLDWEDTDDVSNKTQIANAQIFLNAVEKATGRVPIVYVAPAFWNALGNPAQFARYPLWIANYGASCPQVPPPWKTWALWQSNVGPVSGVEGTEADQDKFNGTYAQLLALAAKRSPNAQNLE